MLLDTTEELKQGWDSVELLQGNDQVKNSN